MGVLFCLNGLFKLSIFFALPPGCSGYKCLLHVCGFHFAYFNYHIFVFLLCFLSRPFHSSTRILFENRRQKLVWIRFYIFAILEIGTQVYKFCLCLCVCVFVLLELNRVPHVRCILLLSDMLSPVFDDLMKCIFFPVWVLFFFWFFFKTRFLCIEVLEFCKLAEVNRCSSNTFLEWIRKLVELLDIRDHEQLNRRNV